MINVFKKHEPAYKRIVRRFAFDIWKNLPRDEVFKAFLNRAKSFKIKYEKDLIQYYQEKEIKIYRGTIREKANQWLENQVNIAESVEIIARAKKDKVKDELFQDFIKTGSPSVQELLNKIYLSESEQKKGGKVLKVFSFSDNLEDKAEQIGSQAAFDLGQEINNKVLSENYDAYDWNDQKDSKVRKTHKKMRKHTFLYSNPPTTIDKYGKRHTGHCGTDWGCRCYGSKPTGKPKINYIVIEYKNGNVSETWDKAA